MPSACLRSLFFLALLVALLVLGAAFYLEFAVGLRPCPLCQSQRFFLGAFAIVCLCALLHHRGRRLASLYAGLALGLASCGALLAWRQIWLQSHTDAAQGGCQHPLTYLIEHSTAQELVTALLLGSRECVVMTWSFLDLSVPEWSLLAFLLLAALALADLLSRLRSSGD